MISIRTKAAPVVLVALTLLAGACGGTTSPEAATRPTTIVDNVVATATAAPAAVPDTSTATTVLRPIATDASTATTLPRATATVDELVRVEGGRLRVRCVGAGDTTVVLIAGFNDGGDNWGRIEPALSQRTRVCSYARFGTGVSDPPSAPQTFATSARDLHNLLDQIGEPGPYTVVGHSYGGAQAVTFASQYHDEVDGLVLLDATPPTWTAAGFAEVAAIDTLGSLPLSIVTAAQHPFPGLDPVEAARLEDVWNQGQEHWMSLSSAAQLVTVDDAGHYVHVDRPDVAIAEIQRLLPAPPSTTVPASVRWAPCGDRLECGSLYVPLDPGDPKEPRRNYSCVTTWL